MRFTKFQLIKLGLLVLSVSCMVGWGMPGRISRAAPFETTASDTLALDTIIVQFPAGTTLADRDRVLAEMGGTLTGWIEPLQIARIRLSPSMRESGGTISARGWGGAMPRFVEYEAPISGTYAPDDPDYYDSGKTYALPAIHADAAWDVTRGSSDTIIAIIDTGISAQHPEFAGRLVGGYDFVHDDNDPSDDHGHGTHVAGIAAAAIDNAQGTAGVCPGCSLMPIKVLNEHNSGTWFNAAQGLVYAVDNGADIINMSLGATTGSETIATAIAYAVSQGVLVVAAAGNEGSHEPFYPAAYDGVLAVSASDSDDVLWGLSNFGHYIDVAAPGYLIYSTDRQLDNTYNGYSFKSGTSMAAPHVAGLAGLLLSQDPKRSPAALTQIISDSAWDLGTPGWDSQFGYGRIDAGAALGATPAAVPPGASGTDTNQHHVFVPIAARN